VQHPGCVQCACLIRGCSRVGPARAGRASPKKAKAGASAGPRRAQRAALI